MPTVNLIVQLCTSNALPPSLSLSLRRETSTTLSYRLYYPRRCLGHCTRNANTFGVINAAAASVLATTPFPI